jgi:hypothetical protein
MRAPRWNNRSNSTRDLSRSARGNPARGGGATGTRLARQPASALGAPALQHLPAALRGHSLAKPVRLGSPATVRLKGPLHRFLLVNAMRTACPSYRPLPECVKRPTPHRARPTPLPPRRAPCYGGPLGRAWDACTLRRRTRHGASAPGRQSSGSDEDGRSPGVIHRRG